MFRGRRRGQRKSKSEEEDEEPLIVADVEIEQDDVAATPFLVEGDDSEPGIILP